MFGQSFRRRISRFMVAIFDTLLEWQSRSEQRRRLRSCGERTLKDLGLSRCDVEAEGRKPFWQA
jgi:uncharacterized protein YjiS (DUF1127 family)